MQIKPFLKWAGGKRWLINHPEFSLPAFTGRYIEPFLGGGAMFLATRPRNALLSDANERLIETYACIRDNWQTVARLLGKYHARHSAQYYYEQRSRLPNTPAGRAAHFIYLNRACWNGLYRVNLRGEFNVPIGTKNWITSADDDFGAVAALLAHATLTHCDFEETINEATEGDLIFADPPYTVAHNMNGFVKYNENIFSWDDQIRLRDALVRARDRGAIAVVTNAFHHSITSLYEDVSVLRPITRHTVISGSSSARKPVNESLIFLQ